MQLHIQNSEKHCMLPFGVENLPVAGRTVSTERMALASIRVMPNCLGIGEAAGIGAASASKKKATIRQIDPQEVIFYIKQAKDGITSDSVLFKFKFEA